MFETQNQINQINHSLRITGHFIGRSVKSMLKSYIHFCALGTQTFIIGCANQVYSRLSDIQEPELGNLYIVYHLVFLVSHSFFYIIP